jgi:undecaprenyl-diphosphatase
MTYLQAIILGIIQGLTEFLPVSSSGHIQLGEAVLGVETTESLSFTVIVHAATVLSTMVVFWKDIAHILQGLVRREGAAWRFAGMVVLSMIPAVVVGLGFEEQLEGLFGEDLTIVGACLLVTAVLLLLTSVAPTGSKDLSFGRAAIVGLAQAIAILPGISRSGSTISTALYLGVDKSKATQFSFLMVIPLILGATLVDLKDMAEAPAGESLPAGILLAGFAAAFVAGLFACQAMVRIVQRGKLWYFAVYCAIVGVLALVLG